MLIRVKNGTSAGRRRVRELGDWPCHCFARRLQPGHRYSCPDCGARRPPHQRT